MRHDKLPRAKARPVTPRRVKAAERALQREQDSHPLFADQLADEQPTPEDRVAQMNAEHVAYWQRIRDHAAQTWRAARRILFSLPADQQRDLLDRWNNGPLPGRAEYFAALSVGETARLPHEPPSETVSLHRWGPPFDSAQGKQDPAVRDAALSVHKHDNDSEKRGYDGQRANDVGYRLAHEPRDNEFAHSRKSERNYKKDQPDRNCSGIHVAFGHCSPALTPRSL